MAYVTNEKYNDLAFMTAKGESNIKEGMFIHWKICVG